MAAVKRILRASLWLLATLALVQLYLFMTYLVILPGVVAPLDEIVTVEGRAPQAAGRFFLTAVSTDRANLLTAAYALLNPAVDIVPVRSEIPSGLDMPGYLEIMRHLMRESQLIAKSVALTAAGFDAPLEGAVHVDRVLEGSPARGHLREGDVIVAIDGQPVSLAQEVVQRVQARSVGDLVALLVERDGERFPVSIRTVALDQQPPVAGIRIIVTSRHRDQFPVQIEVRAGQIKGSSAGLLFALEIYNRLVPDDITRGRLIAGTGALDPTGAVQAVSGVRQKVLAAERGGAEIFLVPPENAAAARAVAREMEVVPVDSFRAAIDFLRSLQPARNTARRSENILPLAQAWSRPDGRDGLAGLSRPQTRSGSGGDGP